MKKNILKTLIMSVAMLFVGCTEESVLVPESIQNSDEVLSSKMERTTFTGTCTLIAPDYPGEFMELPFFMGLLKGETSYWYDDATDSRVKGNSYWTVNSKAQKNGNTIFHGKALLEVDTGGSWDMSYHGWWTWTEGVPALVVDVTGVGKEGPVKGLVAKWVYTFDFDTLFSTNFEVWKYDFKGYIQSK